MKQAILNEYALNGYTVNSNLPIGTPIAWLSDVLPIGFLAFDGKEYNQSDYPELYNVVKNIPAFHSETEGKFKIPNLKGRVLQGADTVQPSAFTVRWIIKATQYASLEQNAIDDSRYTTANVLSASKTKELTQDIYSTEETVIGKWIDGKPLYRTILVYDIVPSEIDMSDLNISTMVEIKGFGDNSQNGDRVDVNFSNGGWFYAIFYRPSHKKLITGATNQVNNGVIILEYTKTTD